MNIISFSSMIFIILGRFLHGLYSIKYTFLLPVHAFEFMFMKIIKFSMILLNFKQFSFLALRRNDNSR